MGTVSLAVAALLAAGTLSYREDLQHQESERWILHTHRVLETLGSFWNALLTAEASERTYLLTGNESYLISLETEVSRANQTVDELRELTSDNPRQQELLRRIGPPLAVALAELKKGVESRRKRALTDAAETSPGEGSLSLPYKT